MSDPDKPISEKQLAANRANAQRSTGPRTPEGKARSAQNARKHGFTASTYSVVRLEELDEVARLKDDLVAVYQPVNSQELYAIERIALAQQSMLRAARLEGGMFTCALDETMCADGQQIIMINTELTHDIEVTRQQNRNYALAEGFHRMVKKSNSWPLFLRYQAQAERLYRRAIEEFERLKKLRPDLPNEPISDSEPEPVQDLADLSPNPSGGPVPPPPPALDSLAQTPAGAVSRNGLGRVAKLYLHEDTAALGDGRLRPLGHSRGSHPRRCPPLGRIGSHGRTRRQVVDRLQGRLVAPLTPSRVPPRSSVLKQTFRFVSI